MSRELKRMLNTTSHTFIASSYGSASVLTSVSLNVASGYSLQKSHDSKSTSVDDC